MEYKIYILGLDTKSGPKFLILDKNRLGALQQARQLCQQRGIPPELLVFEKEVTKKTPLILGG